jgi:predicted nucleic acid-binding protein
MVLVDTSVWIDHFRNGVAGLEKLLKDTEVVCHPLVIGELACGYVKNRDEIIDLLRALPMAPVLDLDEFLHFVDQRGLAGTGLGYIDIQLLGSVQLSDVLLWSSDKKLKDAATRFNLAYRPRT